MNGTAFANALAKGFAKKITNALQDDFPCTHRQVRACGMYFLGHRHPTL